MHDDAHATMTQKRKKTNNSNIGNFSGSLQKINESTMDIKHASACAWKKILSSLFFFISISSH
jgi:hypothetical protein